MEVISIGNKFIIYGGTAANVYKLDPKGPEVKKWTNHSLHIGACVILNENNEDPLYIQQRLRWRSNTFMMYLRIITNGLLLLVIKVANLVIVLLRRRIQV